MCLGLQQFVQGASLTVREVSRVLGVACVKQAWGRASDMLFRARLSRVPQAVLSVTESVGRAICGACTVFACASVCGRQWSVLVTVLCCKQYCS
jgi:hypothetical protein